MLLNMKGQPQENGSTPIPSCIADFDSEVSIKIFHFESSS